MVTTHSDLSPLTQPETALLTPNRKERLRGPAEFRRFFLPLLPTDRAKVEAYLKGKLGIP